jgi:hypothetical protein
MHKYKRKRISLCQTVIILLLLLVTFSLSGCYFSPNSVRLASKNEILQYAAQNFGDATYVACVEEENSKSYILKDNQCSFEYTVKTFAMSYGMDGSVFGYSEHKNSNFEEVYWSYIYDDLSDFIETKEQELGVIFEDLKYSHEYCIGEVIITEAADYDVAVEFLAELANEIIKIDDRGYYRNSKIDLRYENDFGVAGCIYLNEMEFKTSEGATVDFYMQKASDLLDADVQYNRTKVVKKEFVPGLDDFTIASILGTDNETKEDIACYYFTANGKEYFIADIIVNDGQNNVRQHIYILYNR